MLFTLAGYFNTVHMNIHVDYFRTGYSFIEIDVPLQCEK